MDENVKHILQITEVQPTDAKKYYQKHCLVHVEELCSIFPRGSPNFVKNNLKNLNGTLLSKCDDLLAIFPRSNEKNSSEFLNLALSLILR